MNAISVKDLTITYHGGKKPDFSFGPVTLELPKGAILGLLGENGAGKTTLMKLILGLRHPDAGEISLLGGAPGQTDLMEQVGVVLDDPGIAACLTPRQLGKVLGRIFRTWDQGLYEQYLQRMQLPERKAFSEFSKGMKMKLSIAAALSHGAELLILDEATSGLDPVVRDEVLDLLYDFMQDETHAVLLSSHITSDLDKIADNITFIHRGRVLLSEGRDELIDRHGVLRCTEEQLNALDPDAVRAVRKGAFGCEALVKRDGIPENWPVEPVSVEQIMLFLTRGEEA